METKKERSKPLRRLTNEEYRALLDKDKPRSRKCHGRMTDEEYNELWNGNPPKDETSERI